MELTQFILLIFFIIIIILFFKVSNLSNKCKENFTSTSSSSLRASTTSVSTNTLIEAIKFQYKVDIDSMRNLAQIAKKILSNSDTLQLPANTTTSNKLLVQGDLEVNGSVFFKNKNINIMDIFPAYMVIAWAGTNKDTNDKIIIPKGWAVCNGLSYKLDANNIALQTETDAVGSIKTPDLRARFIIGAGGFSLTELTTEDKKAYKGKEVGTDGGVNFPMNYRGGESSHVLETLAMPKHDHFTHYSGPTGTRLDNIDGRGTIYVSNITTLLDETSPPHAAVVAGSGSPNYIMYNAKNLDANVGLTSKAGGNEPHNNLPPYHALIYIMKL